MTLFFCQFVHILLSNLWHHFQNLKNVGYLFDYGMGIKVENFNVFDEGETEYVYKPLLDGFDTPKLYIST